MEANIKTVTNKDILTDGKKTKTCTEIYKETQRQSQPVACRGDADGATAPGIQFGGFQRLSLRKENVDKCLKNKKKGFHGASRRGASNESSFRKKDYVNDYKKSSEILGEELEIFGKNSKKSEKNSKM